MGLGALARTVLSVPAGPRRRAGVAPLRARVGVIMNRKPIVLAILAGALLLFTACDDKKPEPTEGAKSAPTAKPEADKETKPAAAEPEAADEEPEAEDSGDEGEPSADDFD